MTIQALLSSERADWETPWWLVHALEKMYGTFHLDPAATRENCKALSFFDEEADGLRQPWFGRVFVNPPYGPKSTAAWVKKCYEESQRPGVESVVALIPANTDTLWWRDYVMEAWEALLVTGRIQFEIEGKKPRNGSTVANAIVCWHKEKSSCFVRCVDREELRSMGSA